MYNLKVKHKIPKTKNNNGITLIALIITIVVLLILAVVAIGAVQEDAIIGKAKYARDEYGKAQAKENSILQGYLDKINENSGNRNGGSSGNESTGNENTGNENNGNGSIDNEETGNGISNSKTESKSPLVDEYGNDAKNIILSETENTDVYDEYGNKIVVPAGFMIRVDESTTYADHVTEGIVIEDVDGNQFVWVPVGNIYYSETEYKTINFDRYTFEEDGTPIPQGDATINSFYQELLMSEYGNATAKDLQGFINSATTQGGYYLGRYEAGNSNNTLVCKASQAVYTNVTQLDALSLSQNMYTSDDFTSDLVNSYAWDTAIVFIQAFGGSEDYANKNFSTSFEDTGINLDKYCNIYDMSGNVSEWTTETYSDTNTPCVIRGGFYPAGVDSNAADYTSARYGFNITDAFIDNGFRPILYVEL